MLLNQLDKIKQCRVILASGSVNRRNILKQAGLDYEQGYFEISPSGFAEDLPKDRFPSSVDYVIKTSEMKLQFKIDELLEQYKKGEQKQDGRPLIVITADTIISMNDREI